MVENINIITRKFSSLKINYNNNNNILNIQRKAHSASDTDIKDINLDIMPFLKNDFLINKTNFNKPIRKKIRQKCVVKNKLFSSESQNKENKTILERYHCARSQEILSSIKTNNSIKRPKSNETKLGFNKDEKNNHPELNQIYICQPINDTIKYQFHKKTGQRFNLIHDGDVFVCKLPHSRNLITKLLNLRLLRRWKEHKIILTDKEIFSTTVSKTY